MQNYIADESRYTNGMQYRRCGKSGILLPNISLGWWHNFGAANDYDKCREIVRYAFDHGITHSTMALSVGL